MTNLRHRPELVPGVVALLIAGAACAQREPAAERSADTARVATAPDTATKRVDCSPRSDSTAGLAEQWKAFGRYVDVCRVIGPDGSAALEIIAVSAGRYYADRPSGATTTPMPRPILRSMDGKEVGQLLYNYPDDPPREVELTFLDWRDGRPHQIDAVVRDPTVSGDHKLTPMRWDAASGRYVGGTER
jgi:hypothetical protein